MMPDQASTADMLVVKTLVTPTQDSVRLAIAPAVSPFGPYAARTRTDGSRTSSPRKVSPRAVNYSPRGEVFFGFDYAPGRRGFR